MTGKERVSKIMNHEKIDKPAWIPFTGVHAGSLKGYSAQEVLTDSSKLTESLIEAHKLYQPDGMPVIFDLQIEAEILGCKLLWAEKAPPSVTTHPCSSDKEILKIDITKESGRIPMVLETLENLKEKAKDTSLFGIICGPFTLASHLRGNDIFMDMFDDPDYIHQLMAYTTKVAKQMTKIYIDAGFDVISVVDPLVSQISSEHFEEFLSIYFTELFDFIRENNKPSGFFVCGNATRNIEVMCKTKPNSIFMDENIDMVAAKVITDKYNVAVGGNIPLTSVMLFGTQQDNMQFVVGLLDKLENKQNLFISPGCDMPYETPAENIIAVRQAIYETESVREIIANYEAVDDGIEVELPDYANLKKPLVEVFTLDSATCAACTYMMGAGLAAKEIYGDKIDIEEYKIIYKENIARIKKVGVTNLPCVYINGELQFSSIIPSPEELKVAIDNYI
ncbi:MAG: thioredoxin family protein [Clostridiales bacterium]|nr:thioredoxin family protein [Clostridiales bacterium]